MSKKSRDVKKYFFLERGGGCPLQTKILTPYRCPNKILTNEAVTPTDLVLSSTSVSRVEALNFFYALLNLMPDP
jgi:hypothetical protein